MLFAIDRSNRPNYQSELAEIYALRAKVLSDEFQWSGLIVENGLETDQFDQDSAVYLGASLRDEVVATLRLNPSTEPTLTSVVFSNLIQFADLTSNAGLYDVSRLVIRPDVRGDPLGISLDLMCGMYEWGLTHGIENYTAVISTRVLSWLVQIGMDVRPLGLPHPIEGEMTLAALLPVNTGSLQNLYRKSKNDEPRLLSTGFIYSDNRQFAVAS